MIGSSFRCGVSVFLRLLMRGCSRLMSGFRGCSFRDRWLSGFRRYCLLISYACNNNAITGSDFLLVTVRA